MRHNHCGFHDVRMYMWSCMVSKYRYFSSDMHDIIIRQRLTALLKSSSSAGVYPELIFAEASLLRLTRPYHTSPVSSMYPRASSIPSGFIVRLTAVIKLENSDVSP